MTLGLLQLDSTQFEREHQMHMPRYGIYKTVSPLSGVIDEQRAIYRASFIDICCSFRTSLLRCRTMGQRQSRQVSRIRRRQAFAFRGQHAQATGNKFKSLRDGYSLCPLAPRGSRLCSRSLVISKCWLACGVTFRSKRLLRCRCIQPPQIILSRESGSAFQTPLCGGEARSIGPQGNRQDVDSFSSGQESCRKARPRLTDLAGVACQAPSGVASLLVTFLWPFREK
jgi:hypothetical protein